MKDECEHTETKYKNRERNSTRFDGGRERSSASPRGGDPPWWETTTYGGHPGVEGLTEHERARVGQGRA